MDREQINSFSAKLDELEKLVNGGKGSGNFGHSGRPGQVGGSSTGVPVTAGKTGKDLYQAIGESRDYLQEQRNVDNRDGHAIGTEFANLRARLTTARRNLETLKADKSTSYDDLMGRSRYLTRSSEMLRGVGEAGSLSRMKISKETKALFKEMETELRKISEEYEKLGTRKYFDPDLNVER